jgi:response regulator RpfG family c-di-GMP phosphodiesterase
MTTGSVPQNQHETRSQETGHPVFNKPHFVLIVDDDPTILSTTVDTLTLGGYHCLTARSAVHALQILKNPDYIFDLMISDVVMTGMSGIDLMKQAVEMNPDLPVIIMSGTSEVEAPVEALRAGSADYLIKPFDFDELIACVARTLARKITTIERSRANTQTANWKTAARAFALSLDARDKETEGHTERVVAYSLRLGQELGLSENALISLQLGAQLHDIGKIAVPDHVLKKPASLTPEEWIQMKKHPAKGEQMVRLIGLPDASALIVGQHHEQWNGAGYPLGLKEEEISIGARVFSVVDTFDAITSDRCYRRGQPYQVALDELLKYSGTQFDPEVVQAFIRIDPNEWVQLRNNCPSETAKAEHAIAC